MKYSLQIITLLILFINFACNKKEDGIDPNYPTIIEGINPTETNQIIYQLEQTSLSACMSIDTFGFPFFNINYETCVNEEWRFNAPRAEIEERTQEALVDYAQFLNLNGSEEILIKSIATTKGIKYNQFYTSFPDSSPTTWLVTTNQQIYNEIPVRGTYLNVLLSPTNIIGIRGHWYDFIYIPPIDNYTEEDAKKSVYNKTFNNNNTEIIPNESTTWHVSKKLIIPLRRSDSKIHMQVCWALYPSTWEILIDTQTGEIISAINVAEI